MRALIFDVDGTLADTEEQHRLAFNGAFAAAGLRWAWSPADYRELLQVAGGKERIAAYAARAAEPSVDVAALHAEKTRRYTAAVSGGAVALRPGVAALVAEAEAAGVALAIASTTSLENVVALLGATFGRRHPFGVIASGDEVPRKKPAPDIYQLALRRLGIGAEEAVAFEDSGLGLRAALGAGLWTVVTPSYWTEGDDFTGAGVVRGTLAGVTLELLDALRCAR